MLSLTLLLVDFFGIAGRARRIVVATEAFARSRFEGSSRRPERGPIRRHGELDSREPQDWPDRPVDLPLAATLALYLHAQVALVDTIVRWRGDAVAARQA